MLYQKHTLYLGKVLLMASVVIYSKESKWAYTMSIYSFLYPESEDFFPPLAEYLKASAN